MKLEEIDKNLAIHNVDERGLCFFAVREEPFSVYGLYDYKNQPEFCRIPKDVAASTNSGVIWLYNKTAGGRVRFSTNSSRIVVKAETHSVDYFSHMPLTGTAGFDLYIDEPQLKLSRYHRSFVPPFGMQAGYSAEVRFDKRQKRYITINFPLYSGVTKLFIGLDEGASLEKGAEYLHPLPIVFYGSSITQGACASRPGMAFTNMISQRTWLDHINLGFSGNGRAEDSIVEYMSSLPMLAFVSDYDFNAPNAEYLENTHFKMYQKIREAHPDIPYIMISRCSFDVHYRDSIKRRKVISDSYNKAIALGDKNVFYIDGDSVFRGHYADLGTVEGTHPNDLGMTLMADAIQAELSRAFTQALI